MLLAKLPMSLTAGGLPRLKKGQPITARRVDEMEVRLPPGMEESPRPHRSSSSPSSLLSPIFSSSFPSTIVAALPSLRLPPLLLSPSLSLSSRPPLFPNVRPLSLRLRVSSHPLSLCLHPRPLSFPLSPLCLVGLAKKFTFAKKREKGAKNRCVTSIGHTPPGLC